MLQQLAPKRGWAGSHRKFHQAFQALWSEYLRTLQKFREASESTGVNQWKGKGPWLGHDLQAKDFDTIILSLFRCPPLRSSISTNPTVPPPPCDNPDSWSHLTVTKVLECLTSLGFAPTARQLHLLLQYYTHDSIFISDSHRPIDGIRENQVRPRDLVKRALETWERRKRLAQQVEALIRGIEREKLEEEGVKSRISGTIDVDEDPEHLKQLRSTLGEMAIICLEEAIRLEGTIQGEIPDRADLKIGIRYWTEKRDGLIPEWRNELKASGKGKRTKRYQYIIQMLLRDSLLQQIRYRPHLPDHEPLELFRLLLASFPDDIQVIGSAVARIRNSFYHQRRFSDLLHLIELLTVPLRGEIISSLLCAARNPEQFARLLLALLKLPSPATPAQFDPFTRRLLFTFAEQADTTRLRNLVPIIGQRYKDLLLYAFDRWGTGLPGKEIVGKTRPEMKVKVPRGLAQVANSKHLDYDIHRKRSIT